MVQDGQDNKKLVNVALVRTGFEHWRAFVGRDEGRWETNGGWGRGTCAPRFPQAMGIPPPHNSGPKKP